MLVLNEQLFAVVFWFSFKWNSNGEEGGEQISYWNATQQ